MDFEEQQQRVVDNLDVEKDQNESKDRDSIRSELEKLKVEK